jgi:hypothetical protein
LKGLRLKKQYINGKRENFHSNSPVRLKKSLWESRTTATLVISRFFAIESFATTILYWSILGKNHVFHLLTHLYPELLEPSLLNNSSLLQKARLILLRSDICWIVDVKESNRILFDFGPRYQNFTQCHYILRLDLLLFLLLSNSQTTKQIGLFRKRANLPNGGSSVEM